MWHLHLTELIARYGAWLVGGIVALESMGVPLPGETTLVSAALYAGSTGQLSIEGIVIAAACGAIAGDSVGFWIGRAFGYPLVVRHGRGVGLTPERLKIGQYLFRRHGGKVVFFGRFIAILRTLAALLAGINGMAWRRFVIFNAAGGILWACAYGVGAYALGHSVTDWMNDAGRVAAAVAAALVVAAFLLARRFEGRLRRQAERHL